MADVARYVPGQYYVCRTCGQVSAQHHSDDRCYTAEELQHRQQFYQRTRRWPGPDEGCDPQEEDTARRYRVLRQDDNGHIFLVQGALGYDEACALELRLTARGHKQMYWVEAEDRHPDAAPEQEAP